METPIYQEKQVLKFRGLIALAMLSGFIIVAFLEEVPIEMKLLILVVELVMLVVVWTFFELNTLVTQTDFQIKMGLIKRKLNTSEIQIGQILDIPKLAGVGMHYYRGKWVWNASFGRGVSVYSAKGTEFLVGSQNPEQLQTALLQVAKRKI